MHRTPSTAVTNPGNGGTATPVDTTTWNQPSTGTGGWQVDAYVTAQPITVFYDVMAAKDGTFRTVNGGGAGVVVAAGNDFHAVYMASGYAQRIRLVNGATAPTVYQASVSPVGNQLLA